MSILSRARMYRRVFARASSQPGFVRLLRKRPAILFGVSAYEFALFASDGIDSRLKSLAQLKTASLVGCPY